MEKTPLISVIVPVYNSEKFLSKCLDSLILQTYDNLEILCINDGSQDGSLNILKKYSKNDSRIKIINQKNFGQSHARNQGLEIAQGDYITFVDSDDWVSLALYSKFVKVLNTIKNIDTYMYNYTSYSKKQNINMFNLILGIQPDKWRLNTNNLYEFSDCFDPFCGNMAVWNKIYSKHLLKDNEIKFEEDYIFEDQLFYIETLFESKNIYINFDVQYFYRENETSIVHNLGGNAFDIFRIFSLIEKFLKEKGLFENYKYLFLQHKYQEYCSILFKIVAPIREKFYTTARQNLLDLADNYDNSIVKELKNSNIYFDIISLEFEEYIAQFRRK